MVSFRITRNVAVIASMSAALCVPALAEPLLQPSHQGNVTYISGGVGLDEQNALKADAHEYDLAISNSNRAGQFTTGTALTIDTTGGRSILQVSKTGPLFYAQLPPGNYVIHAMNEGQQRTREVRVGRTASADIHLIWPQNG